MLNNNSSQIFTVQQLCTISFCYAILFCLTMRHLLTSIQFKLPHITTASSIVIDMTWHNTVFAARRHGTTWFLRRDDIEQHDVRVDTTKQSIKF